MLLPVSLVNSYIKKTLLLSYMVKINIFTKISTIYSTTFGEVH